MKFFTRVSALLLIGILVVGIISCAKPLTQDNSVTVTVTDREGVVILEKLILVEGDLLNAAEALQSAAEKAGVSVLLFEGFPVSIADIGSEEAAGWIMFVDHKILRASLAETGLKPGQSLQASFLPYADYAPKS